jgi:hypothetical protein
MESALLSRTIVRRQRLTLESLRVLVNIEISVYTECHGVYIRRVFVTEPDPSGCNWQAELPTVHAATAEPCRTQLRGVIEQIRERYNVAL